MTDRQEPPPVPIKKGSGERPATPRPSFPQPMQPAPSRPDSGKTK